MSTVPSRVQQAQHTSQLQSYRQLLVSGCAPQSPGKAYAPRRHQQLQPQDDLLPFQDNRNLALLLFCCQPQKLPLTETAEQSCLHNCTQNNSKCVEESKVFQKTKASL